MTTPAWNHGLPRGATRAPAATRFGILLREHRIANRMSQMELARRMGMSRPVICRYEYGDRHPSPETLKRLVTVLRLTKEQKDELVLATGGVALETVIRHRRPLPLQPSPLPIQVERLAAAWRSLERSGRDEVVARLAAKVDELVMAVTTATLGTPEGESG